MAPRTQRSSVNFAIKQGKIAICADSIAIDGLQFAARNPRNDRGLTFEIDMKQFEDHGAPECAECGDVIQMVFRCVEHNGLELSLSCAPHVTGGIVLLWQMCNHSAQPVRPGEIRMSADRQEGGVVDLGEGCAETMMFCASGGCAWDGVKDLDSHPKSKGTEFFEDQPDLDLSTSAGDYGQHRSNGFTVVYNPVTSKSLLVGNLSFRRIHTHIELDYDAAAGGIDRFSVCWTSGVFELQPGGVLESDPLLLFCSPDPLAILEQYGRCVRDHERPMLLDHPVVEWTGHYGCGFWEPDTEENSEQIVRAHINWFTREHPEFLHYGLRYLHLDLGYTRDDLIGAWLEENRDRYPTGIAALAECARQAGLILGFCLDLEIMYEQAGVLEGHLDWCLPDEEGNRPVRTNKLRFGQWSHRDLEQCPWTINLDPTHPGVEQWMRRVLRKYRTDYHCRYIMYDFCYGSANPWQEYHNNKLVPGYETQRRSFQIVAEELGADAYMEVSSAGWLPSVGLFPGCRIGLDSAGATADASHLKDYGSNAFHDWFMDGNFWANDACMVTIASSGGKRCEIPLSVKRLRLLISGMSGGTFDMGDDMRLLSDEEIRLLTQALPVYPHAARPLDLWSSPTVSEVWHWAIDTKWDSWHVVGLVNFDDKPRDKYVRLADLGLDPSQRLAVWSFWEERIIPLTGAKLSRTIPAVGTELFAIRRIRNEPMVLSTDMHISQGAVELADVRFDAKKGELNGEVLRAPGTQGRIFVHLPTGFAPAENDKAIDSTGMGRVFAFSIHQERAKTLFTIRVDHGCH